MNNRLKEIVDAFPNQRVLVVGDVMIDAYCWGKVDRISPEAPVPVVAVQKWDYRLGGAANVALNAVALEANVAICSVVGNDNHGKRCMDLFAENSIDTQALIHSNDRPTTVKTRVIAAGHHLVRIDEEVTFALNDNEEKNLLDAFDATLLAFQPQVIVLEDYNKGVLTPKVIEHVLNQARIKQIPTTVDPKKDNFLAYQNCTLFKPNLKELREGLKMEVHPTQEDSIKSALDTLNQALQAQMSMVTLSEHGIAIWNGDELFQETAHVRKIVDVSGAGDSVIAVASLALSAGASQNEIAQLSNLAGGLVCEKVGVVPITREMLYKEI
jgi:rfaE bifunctional protein kinase chain/domain